MRISSTAPTEGEGQSGLDCYTRLTGGCPNLPLDAPVSARHTPTTTGVCCPTALLQQPQRQPTPMASAAPSSTPWPLTKNRKTAGPAPDQTTRRRRRKRRSASAPRSRTTTKRSTRSTATAIIRVDVNGSGRFQPWRLSPQTWLLLESLRNWQHPDT